jgi:hypothetical protein
MTSLEKRIETALGAIVQHIPETQEEASGMTGEQWASFQDAASICNKIFKEMSGAIRHNGTVGREAPEFVNNAAGALIVALEHAIESGSVPKKLFLALVEKFGLDVTQGLTLARINAFEERAEAVGKQRDDGLVIFSDEFAQETGNWPRPAGYYEG